MFLAFFYAVCMLTCRLLRYFWCSVFGIGVLNFGFVLLLGWLFFVFESGHACCSAL